MSDECYSLFSFLTMKKQPISPKEQKEQKRQLDIVIFSLKPSDHHKSTEEVAV
jgi:hypothetical protein